MEKQKVRSKRCNIDFSQHEVLVTEQKGLLIHHLKKPGTVVHNIKYINTNGIMAVTGDFGNWIFCREFHPSSEGYVSEGYWAEKLEILSEQKAMEFDSEATRNELNNMIEVGAEAYGYSGDELEQVIEYFEECLDNVDDELDYTNYAYRSYPSCMDFENVIFEKKFKRWLLAIFDGFDEICRRMKEEETKS